MKSSLIPLAIFAAICCPLAEGENEAARAANEFAIDLSREVMEKSGGNRNLFLSPISVYLAFAMTYAGAKTKTARQLEKALKWSQLGSQEQGHKAIEGLTNSVVKSLSHKDRTLSVANKLWLQTGFCITSCKKFKNTLQKSYDADIDVVNFATNSSGALQEINKWVDEKTGSKIKDLLKPGMVSAMTRLIITNAVYFKSQWKYQFKPERTFPRSFFIATEKVVSTPMMSVTGNFKYYEDDKYKVLELPYAVPEVAMMIYLPRYVSDFVNLQKDLDVKFISRYASRMRKRKVIVQIPKFKMTSELNLKDFMKALGVSDLFDASAADLSGITGFKGLHVQTAVHKAFVDVSEEGTEAAAATAVVVGFRSFRPSVFTFTANRPFIFLIRHVPSSALLFVGHVANPTT